LGGNPRYDFIAFIYFLAILKVFLKKKTHKKSNILKNTKNMFLWERNAIFWPTRKFFKIVPKLIMSRVFLLCHDGNKTVEKYGVGTFSYLHKIISFLYIPPSP
jgi:hypothetical protein